MGLNIGSIVDQMGTTALS